MSLYSESEDSSYFFSSRIKIPILIFRIFSSIWGKNDELLQRNFQKRKRLLHQLQQQKLPLQLQSLRNLLLPLRNQLRKHLRIQLLQQFQKILLLLKKHRKILHRRQQKKMIHFLHLLLHLLSRVVARNCQAGCLGLLREILLHNQQACRHQIRIRLHRR